MCLFACDCVAFSVQEMQHRLTECTDGMMAQALFCTAFTVRVLGLCLTNPTSSKQPFQK